VIGFDSISDMQIGSYTKGHRIELYWNGPHGMDHWMDYWNGPLEWITGMDTRTCSIVATYKDIQVK